MREGENGDSDDTDRETEEESGGSGDAEEEETCNERMKKLEDDINRISEQQKLMGTALEGVKQKTDKIEAIKQVLLSKGWPAVRPIFLRPKYRRMVRSIRKGGIKNAELLKELMTMINYFMDEAETGKDADRLAETVGEMASASRVASKEEKIRCGEGLFDWRMYRRFSKTDAPFEFKVPVDKFWEFRARPDIFPITDLKRLGALQVRCDHAVEEYVCTTLSTSIRPQLESGVRLADSLDLRDLMEGLDTKSMSKFIEELSELADLSFDEVIEKIYE